MNEILIGIFIFGLVLFFLFVIKNLIQVIKVKKYNKLWNRIESLNLGLGINRNTTSIDENGYLRWKNNYNLCHRDIAFEKKLHYNKGIRFSECNVHHIDRNKLNNNPNNLEVVSREEHAIEHGIMIIQDGKKYLKIARVRKIYRETSKAILIARKWIPKSQVKYKNGYVYVSEWIYYTKFQ